MNRPLHFSVLVAALLLAVAPPASRAADPALLGLADPASNFVIGIDVQALAASPLAQEALLKAQTENPTWGQALGTLGPNPLSRIQEVVIAGDVEQAREDSKGLVLIKGDFASDDWMSFACQAGCSSESYRGFTVQGLQSADKPSAFVRLDASYVALGSLDQVRGVVDRRASGAGSSFAGQVQGWTSNAGRHHVWIAAKGPFDMPHQGADPMGMRNVANLDAFGMGLTLAQDLQVGLELRSMSAAESVALHQSLQGLLMMVTMNAQQDPDTAELLRGFTIGQSAQTVNATLRVPGYLLKRMAEKRSQAGSGAAAAVQMEPSQPTPRPRQPRQGIIRIEGLDSGPVVVESEPQQ
ncbi:MAG: hypothetical protein O3A53_03910 [Acidobacteria bacterium]|nr:hypothetical protein [Acidobacteriota bacterium]MDA1233923.1 hypothetical protein [Acidobacteriota bacterium]